MSLKLNSIKADLAKESEGDWVAIPEWPGVRFKVRSIHCKDYLNAREMKVQGLVKALGRLPTSSELEPHIGKLVSAFLLLDWDGLLDDNDKPLPYSAERARELLGDPAMRELVQQVIWAANRIGTRDAEFVADAVKNSEAPSVTT